MPVPRETFDRIAAFVDRLRSSSTEQNLIAASTLDFVWERHILDSAQLVRFEPRPGASWVDVGSGAGLPGIVIACLVEGPVTLVEPRRLRAQFLTETVEALGFEQRVTVEGVKAERVRGRFDVITARGVAALNRLLSIAHHLSRPETVWVLPKGKNTQSELAQARGNWHCVDRVEKSSTDRDSEILVLTRVGAKQSDDHARRCESEGWSR